MLSHPGFLKAIIAEPAEDAVRLVYADWLEEQGEGERAEFIRIQCQLSAWKCSKKDGPFSLHGCNPTKNGPACKGLRERERELLAKNKFRWVGIDETKLVIPLYLQGEYLPYPFEWSRGFVSGVTCTAEDWLKNADALTSQTPLERVTLTTWPTYTQFARYEWKRVDFYSIGVGRLMSQLFEEEWPGIKFDIPARTPNGEYVPTSALAGLEVG